MIASLALVLGIVNLVYTCTNQREQNARWDALNAGSFQFAAGEIVPWRIIAQEDWDKINWGYRPIFLKNDATGEHLLIGRIVGVNKPEMTLVAAYDTCATIADFENQVTREGKKLADVEPQLEIKFRFTFENSGKTELMNCSSRVEILNQDGEFTTLSNNADKAVDVSAGGRLDFDVSKLMNLNEALPNDFVFRIKNTYTDIHGQVRRKEEIVSCSFLDGQWQVTNINDALGKVRPVTKK